MFLPPCISAAGGKYILVFRHICNEENRSEDAAMLPDISRRNRLRGYHLGEFDKKAVSDIIDHPPKADGLTNNKGVVVVREMNEYLNESLCTLIQVSVITQLFSEADAVLKGKTFGICHTIKQQRYIIKKMKNIMKVNKVDDNWYELIKKEMQLLNERLNRIKEISIPLLLEPTPYAVYLRCMREQEKTPFEDMEHFIHNDISIYEDMNNNEEYLAYCEHVQEIIDKNTTEEDLIEIERARARVERRKAYKQSVYDREKAEYVKKKRDEAEEIVMAMSSNIDKQMKKICPDRLYRIRNSRADKYVVVAARVPTSKTAKVRIGYVIKGGDRVSTTSNIRKASLMNREDAEKFAKYLTDKNYVTSIGSIYIDECVVARPDSKK